MPVMNQTQVLPYQKTYKDQLVEALIQAAPQFVLAMATKGMSRVPVPPTPGQPGQLQFPGGMRTPTSPDELAQIQSMGGVPTTRGSVVPLRTGLGSGVRYQPPTVHPDQLSAQLQQAQLQQSQSELAQAPMKQKKLEAETAREQAYADWLKKAGLIGVETDPATGQPRPTPGMTPPPSSAQAGTPTASPAPSTITERYLKAAEVFPGQVVGEALVRSAGRATRMRETASGLEKSYSAKTAQASRGLGDTANIAVEERKMILDSFPRDNDSFESRVTTERSMQDFFDRKEAFLTEIIHRPVSQVIRGVSRSGPRYEADPAAMAAKKQATEDLNKLQATRLLYEQMYAEAAQKMPPIGAQSTTQAPAASAPVAAGGPSDGATATNPKTGERIMYRNGQWQPVK